MQASQKPQPMRDGAASTLTSVLAYLVAKKIIHPHTKNSRILKELALHQKLILCKKTSAKLKYNLLQLGKPHCYEQLEQCLMESPLKKYFIQGEVNYNLQVLATLSHEATYKMEKMLLEHKVKLDVQFDVENTSRRIKCQEDLRNQLRRRQEEDGMTEFDGRAIYSDASTHQYYMDTLANLLQTEDYEQIHQLFSDETKGHCTFYFTKFNLIDDQLYISVKFFRSFAVKPKAVLLQQIDVKNYESLYSRNTENVEVAIQQTVFRMTIVPRKYDSPKYELQDPFFLTKSMIEAPRFVRNLQIFTIRPAAQALQFVSNPLNLQRDPHFQQMFENDSQPIELPAFEQMMRTLVLGQPTSSQVQHMTTIFNNFINQYPVELQAQQPPQLLPPEQQQQRPQLLDMEDRQLPQIQRRDRLPFEPPVAPQIRDFYSMLEHQQSREESLTVPQQQQRLIVHNFLINMIPQRYRPMIQAGVYVGDSPFELLQRLQGDEDFDYNDRCVMVAAFLQCHQLLPGNQLTSIPEQPLFQQQALVLLQNELRNSQITLPQFIQRWIPTNPPMLYRFGTLDPSSNYDGCVQIRQLGGQMDQRAATQRSTFDYNSTQFYCLQQLQNYFNFEVEQIWETHAIKATLCRLDRQCVELSQELAQILPQLQVLANTGHDLLKFRYFIEIMLYVQAQIVSIDTSYNNGYNKLQSVNALCPQYTAEARQWIHPCQINLTNFASNAHHVYAQVTGGALTTKLQDVKVLHCSLDQAMRAFNQNPFFCTPSPYIQSGSTCHLCQDDLYCTFPFVQLACSHSLHKTCLSIYIQTRQVCPMCNQALDILDAWAVVPLPADIQMEEEAVNQNQGNNPGDEPGNDHDNEPRNDHANEPGNGNGNEPRNAHWDRNPANENNGNESEASSVSSFEQLLRNETQQVVRSRSRSYSSRQSGSSSFNIRFQDLTLRSVVSSNCIQSQILDGQQDSNGSAHMGTARQQRFGNALGRLDAQSAYEVQSDP